MVRFCTSFPPTQPPFSAGSTPASFSGSAPWWSKKTQIAAIAAKHTRCNLLTNRVGLLYAAYLKARKVANMNGRLFLYTPRSGSKIIAQSQCPMAPRWAVETLTNGSHVIHYTAPLYRVPASTRRHRADVGSILKHVARSENPRSLLAWDDCGDISFMGDERSIMDIEQIVRKFGRGEGLVEAIQHQREEAEIFGSSGPDTRLFAHPVSTAILHVTNGYVSTHPAHKSRATIDIEPATFGDLPCSDAQYITSEVLDALWNGMSAPVPTPEEADQIAAKFAAWMSWPEDTAHREDMKAMLLEPVGPEMQDWANEFFSTHHRLSLGWNPDYPAHWADESKEDEGEATEPTPEPIAESAPEPTEEDVAAQKKNEADAAFAEIWREHLRGSIAHWMAANLDHPYPCLDSDADVIVAHGAICRRVAGVWAGWSNLWWRSPDIYSRAIEEDGLFPASLPMIPRSEEGDSPNNDVWTEWIAALNPNQLLAFLLYTSEAQGNEADWGIEGFNTNEPADVKKIINALSHAFPFPFAHAGLEPHPTKKERWVLKDWHDFYLNRRHLPLARWDILRRHFAALVKMAEHAPE